MILAQISLAKAPGATTGSNRLVVMLHMTLFASLISVDELFRAAQRINAQIYKPVEIYSAVGLFFLLVSLPLNGLALYLRRKHSRDLSER